MQLIELWGLGDEFKKWVDEACVFTSTLVDRIITGYPRATEQEEWEKLGYEDHIMVTGEPFALWVIESAKDISKEFPLPDAGLPVIFTDNQKPYKQRKVRILNGAHTSFVLASYLCGNDIVRQSMHDDDIRNFMLKTIYDEVIPTLSLPEEELKQFAGEVVNRFDNPYVDHALLAISLNSVSKWRARCMPSLLGYVEKTGKLPAHLTFSIAALMAFYTGTEIRDKALIGEFIHTPKHCIINQREIGLDCQSYANALRAAMREDPDIILLGELRDRETMSTAMTAVETGHLVFSTVHTEGAAKTIDRLIDIFPADQQQQIRVQLSTSLKAVISQRLLPRATGGRVAAFEMMFVTKAISNLIRENKTANIDQSIQLGSQTGMITMKKSIEGLLKQGIITAQTAKAWSFDIGETDQLIT